MSLKEQLPSGSPRNKIEFLADYIEQQIAEMNQGSEAPENLLINPAFDVIESDLTPTSGGQLVWLGTPHKIASQSGNFGVRNATTYPMPVGWSIECLSSAGTGSASVQILATDGDSLLAAKNSNVNASVIPTAHQSGMKFCTFSIFRAPMMRSSRVINEVEGVWVYTKPQYSAYFVGRNLGATFGIAKIDNAGSVEKIVASKAIQQSTNLNNLVYAEENPNGDILIEDWLHGIELEEGGVYAYFVSETSRELAPHTMTHIAAAGVFLNQTKQNIKPSFQSKVSPDKHLKCSHSLGVVAASNLSSGFTADLTGYSMPYGIDKHTLFCVVSNDKWRMQVGAGTSATKLTETSATITCSAGGAVDFYYSETPLTIDFFNAV